MTGVPDSCFGSVFVEHSDIVSVSPIIASELEELRSDSRTSRTNFSFGVKGIETRSNGPLPAGLVRKSRIEIYRAQGTEFHDRGVGEGFGIAAFQTVGRVGSEAKMNLLIHLLHSPSASNRHME